MKTELFTVTGMTCSACSARVEKAINGCSGVKSAVVNLLTETLKVEFNESTISTQDIINKVESVGYGASKKSSIIPSNSTNSANSYSRGNNLSCSNDCQTSSSIHQDYSITSNPSISGNPNKNANNPNKIGKKDKKSEQNSLKIRLIVSIIFTLPLFYLSMGDMMGLPIPSFFKGVENALTFAFTLFLLCLPVVFINRQYFINGFKNIIRRSPNMDSLICIGSGSALLYGIFAIYKIGWGLGHGDTHTAHKFMMDLYLESSAMILTLITLGKYFESRAKKKTTDAVARLIKLAPSTAVVVRGGIEQIVPVSEVVVGDILVVKTGDSVAVDGVVCEGFGAVDQSAITGESLPVDRVVGDKVIGGTVNTAGYFKMEAKSVGADTALYKIIQLVEDATQSKAPIAKLADKISGIFVPIVISIALISMITWLILGQNFEFGLTVAIAVLVISCPCALGLATPTAIMVGTGKGAQNGILIKSATSLEVLHGVDVAVLDKTGTVTVGRPSVCDVLEFGVGRDRLIMLSASLERLSNHPFAEAILAVFNGDSATSIYSDGTSDSTTDSAYSDGTGDSAGNSKSNLEFIDVTEFENILGEGVAGNVAKSPIINDILSKFNSDLGANASNDLVNAKSARLFGGNRKLMRRCGADSEICEKIEQDCAKTGKTPLFFAINNHFLGAFVVADAIKPTSKSAVMELKRMGIEVVMLTGDNQATASYIGSLAGIDRVVAGVLPNDKESEVRRLQEEGKRVVMIGDGINDAPALARADAGIAIGAGTDIAIESADIVLIKSDLEDAVGAIKLSKAVMRTIKQNLFWAFCYNAVSIPIAAGVFYGLFGVLLSPMIAAGAMSFSSVSVVLNALRLNLFKVKSKSKSAKSTSKSESISESESTSNSESISESESTSKSESISESESTSNSESIYESESTSNSEYTIKSISESVSDGDAKNANADNINTNKKENINFEQSKESKPMSIILHVEGMTCPHCVAHLTKALESIEGVKKAEVDLKSKTAVIESNSDSVTYEILVEAVSNAGYEVLG